ncbi:hypothetical protein [Desulforamulus putei]|uniref:Uncharacterized protein n=1 Tax=Desulforamulus putei DSM 12395 TaxID=1121429 RepID=A0A1M4ZPW5_9FIRM|nr:hypothetical protein [Desulforamulus putei]SHF19852.1 hypothetical protein SAMN02745133_02054 [Desulforamulus putei DSM 12395]
MSEHREKIIEALKEAAKEGRLSCTAARKIASEFNVPPKVVGDLCNELKIKIKACELGCF